MTDRDEYRARCIKAMLKAFFDTQKELGYAPKRDHPDCHICLTAAFDALHGIACVGPVEATEEMKMHARISSNTSPENLWRVMSTAGNLTSPPEKKP